MPFRRFFQEGPEMLRGVRLTKVQYHMVLSSIFVCSSGLNVKIHFNPVTFAISFSIPVKLNKL